MLVKDRKPYGYWKDEDNAIAEAIKVMGEHGFDELPCQKKLGELGYGGLRTAIGNYHGGMRKFREILGQKQPRIENGLWKDLEYTINEAKKFMKEHGFDVLPGLNKFSELGCSSLYSAIYNYHGGMRKFREILGQKQLRIENGLWKDLDYCIGEAIKVMDEHRLDVLPSKDKLTELGCSSLGNVIVKYHGGFRKFREILGQKQKKKKDGVWKSLEYTLEQARKIMKEHGFDSLPGLNKFAELGCSSLGVAINKHHGGFRKFREILGQKQKKKKDGVWKSLEYTLEQARKIMKKHRFDKLPTQDKLNELGYSGLTVAIQRYHGNFPAFRAKLNDHLGIKSEKEKLEELLGDYAGE